MTLNNQQPSNAFYADTDGLGVLWNATTPPPNADTDGFDISFSSEVQLLSYNVGFVQELDNDESLTFTNGTSTSIENSPFTTDSRNFATQFCVAANETINVMAGGVDVNSTTDVDILQFITITVESSPSSPAPAPAGIPTLSEWGLLILALLFMTLGTLYLLQPKFRGGIFEQER